LIASFVRSARGGAGGKVSPAEAISRVEKALGLQLGAILQHPEVRRLEEAYRGVKLVLERAESHRGILFDIVSARPADMPAAFARTLAAGAGREHPVSFAVVDVGIDGSAASLALLEAIAKVAEEGPCPAVVSAKSELFGTASLAEVEKLDHKAGVFEAKERMGWRATAGKPSLLWVTMAANRVLARTAYTKSSSRVREAAVAEQPADAGATVWTAPAYVLGALVVQSFRQCGWPCRIVGPRSGGALGNLPVHEVAGASEESEVGAAIPTEVFFSTETQRDLAKIGVLALASAPNTDSIVLLQAPTAYVPPPKKTWGETTAGPEIRAERASLVDQLFVARVAQFLRALCGKTACVRGPERGRGARRGRPGRAVRRREPWRPRGRGEGPSRPERHQRRGGVATAAFPRRVHRRGQPGDAARLSGARATRRAGGRALCRGCRSSRRSPLRRGAAA
jgi:type VI secretion system protein ImpC